MNSVVNIDDLVLFNTAKQFDLNRDGFVDYRVEDAFVTNSIVIPGRSI